jgi:hypothetical protein
VKIKTGNAMSKNKYFVISLAFLLFLPGSGRLKNQTDFQPPPSIPAQISEFYEDYNFVASFSTPAEREELINLFARETLPANVRSDRMNRVFRMMKELYTHIFSIDPKMVNPLVPRTQYIKYFFLPELLDVKKIDRSDKKAVVEVCAYSVGPEFVNRFISEYEKNNGEGKKLPSEDERMDLAKENVFPRTEFHIWFLQDGKWMRAEHKNIYIKQSSSLLPAHR